MNWRELKKSAHLIEKNKVEHEREWENCKKEVVYVKKAIKK
jgi:hypothetical protein